jgi:predicted phage terminase large subunit-like protein
MEVTPGKKEPDFTEHGVIGYDGIGDIWIIDWWFDQCETDVGIRQFLRLVGLYKPARWWNEGGIIDKAISPAIRSEMRRKRTFVALEMLPSIQDKSMKLQAFHARYTSRTVHWPLRKKWVDHVIDQLIKFPAGKHDDAADVCGLLGRGVDKMYAANLPAPPRRDILVPFTEAWLEFNERNQKPKERFFA